MSVALAKDSASSRFESLKASRLFPGRKTLYPHEVYRTLRIAPNHLFSLIEEGFISAVRINGAGNKSDRSNYRIPVDEYDRLVLHGGTRARNKKEQR